MALISAESLQGRLLFAIPKKGYLSCLESLMACRFTVSFMNDTGRLHEKCLELLAGDRSAQHYTPNPPCELLTLAYLGADIQFRRNNRLDVCLVVNHPIAL